MVEQFPIVLRGYDKDRVDEAFASAQETVNRLREQVKADDQTILELQAQLQEEKNKIKSLIADISHQTKTPIANLMLYSELLSEEELPPQMRSNVEAIRQQSEKLRFLIDSLVKLSRLENGILTLSPHPQPLQPLLDEIAAQYTRKAGEKGGAEGDGDGRVCPDAQRQKGGGQRADAGLDGI